MKSISIRVVLALFVVLTISPLLAVGWLAASQYIHFQQQAVEAQAREVIIKAVASMERDLESAQAALSIFSLSRAVRERDFGYLQERAALFLRKFPDSALYVKSLTPTVAALPGMTEAMGLQVSAAQQKAIATSQMVISDIVLDRQTNRYFICLVQPVTVDEKVEIVLTLTLPVERFLNVLMANRPSAEWLLAAVDKKYQVIARTRDPEKYYGTSSNEDYRRNTQTESGTFRAQTLDGVPSLITFARSDMAGWVLSAAVPVSVVEQPARKSNFYLGIAVLGALVCCVLIALLLSSMITRSVDRLVSDAKTMGQGQSIGLNHTAISEFNDVQIAMANSSRNIARLVGELNHRVKNILTVVQAIIVQSLPRNEQNDAFKATLAARLNSFAESQDNLIGAPRHHRSLRTLIESEIAPFLVKNEILISGEHISLIPNATFALGLVVHELSTNSIKYGALSRPEGRIAIDWKIENGEFVFRWTEQTGKTHAIAGERGYGVTLIRSAIEETLGGTTVIDFADDGLHFVARCELRKVVQG